MTPTFIVPGYIGNQRIEATRRRRRRRLANLFGIGALLALAAAVLASFTGCGVEKECLMQTKSVDVPVFSLGRFAASTGTSHEFNLELTVPDRRLAWSLRTFLSPTPERRAQNTNTPVPETGYFDYPEVPGVVGQLYWDLYPIAPADGPAGTVARYEVIRHADLPDGWEEDGSSAERFRVALTYVEVEWHHWFGLPPGPYFPVATHWVRATFSPSPGACFAAGEYKELIGLASLRNPTRIIPEYGVF